MKSDILHDSPDNGQTTHFGGKGINLIGALSNIAEETFDSIGCLNVAVHRRWKRVKGEQMLFILSQAAYRFRIPLSIFGFKRLQIGECILFLLLPPNSAEFRLNLLSLASRDGTEDITLLMD
jgi:hypothetical protein